MPWSVDHELPQRSAKGDADCADDALCCPTWALRPQLLFPAYLFAPFRGLALCGCAEGIGEADLLSNGEGAGEGRRSGVTAGGVSASSPRSLRPEINRLVRGRRVLLV